MLRRRSVDSVSIARYSAERKYALGALLRGTAPAKVKLYSSASMSMPSLLMDSFCSPGFHGNLLSALCSLQVASIQVLDILDP